MKNFLAQLWRDFFSLFYPPQCLACEGYADDKKSPICLSCQATLPQTDFHQHKENAFVSRFDGRVPLQSAQALYFFTKSSRTQHLVHRIKYDNQREAAFELGRYYGMLLSKNAVVATADALVPVPMHPLKLRLRGYNQAEIFSEGISESLQVPVKAKLLIKNTHTTSQTKKNRLERLANTDAAFSAQFDTPSVWTGKHIVLVDDVMTTGATLEACATALLSADPTLKISFVSLAFAKK